MGCNEANEENSGTRQGSAIVKAHVDETGSTLYVRQRQQKGQCDDIREAAAAAARGGGRGSRFGETDSAKGSLAVEKTTMAIYRRD